MDSFIKNCKKQNFSYEKFCEMLKKLSFKVLIKESKDYPELFLIWASQEKCKSNDVQLQREMNGIVLKKDGFDVVCRSFDNYITNIEWGSDFYVDESKKRIEVYEEGTFLRLFFYKENWIVSSLKCINVKETFIFGKKKNFYDLFWEAGKNLDIDKLDKNFSYSFIMKHKDNRCGILYKGDPVLVYCGKFDVRNWNPSTEKVYAKDLKKEVSLDNFDIADVSDIVDNVEIEFSQEVIDKEIERTDLSTKGIIVVLENGDRISFMNKKFLEISEIRGTNPCINIRYMELDEEKRLKLIEYFPEYKLEKIEENIDKKALQIFKTYQKCYVYNAIEPSEILYNIRNFVEKVHNYAKENKKRVTKEMCHKRLLESEPKELGDVMQWFLKNKKK